MEELPDVEHRMCARHIWSNWSKKWRGKERRKSLWLCARSSFEVELKDHLQEMSKLGKGIVEELLCYNKENWVRVYQGKETKCDSVENNMCETFNAWILISRHKSIITMLNEIRTKIMQII